MNGESRVDSAKGTKTCVRTRSNMYKGRGVRSPVFVEVDLACWRTVLALKEEIDTPSFDDALQRFSCSSHASHITAECGPGQSLPSELRKRREEGRREGELTSNLHGQSRP